MILALILPVAVPVVALICLLAAYRPSRFSRRLLGATGWILLAFSLWYVAAFIFGIF